MWLDLEGEGPAPRDPWGEPLHDSDDGLCVVLLILGGDDVGDSFEHWLHGGLQILVYEVFLVGTVEEEVDHGLAWVVSLRKRVEVVRSCHPYCSVPICDGLNLGP